jgi:hypothetical protein
MAQNLSLEWNGMCSRWGHEYSPSRHAGTMPRRVLSLCLLLARSLHERPVPNSRLKVANLPARLYVSMPLHSYWRASTNPQRALLPTSWMCSFIMAPCSSTSRPSPGGDHTSVDDLWNHPLYAEIVRPLQRGTVIHGTTSRSSFQECLQKALCFADSIGEQSVALVVTKPPETILLFCKHVHRGGPWFLFDSHGHILKTPREPMSCNVIQWKLLQLLYLRNFHVLMD